MKQTDRCRYGQPSHITSGGECYTMQGVEHISGKFCMERQLLEGEKLNVELSAESAMRAKGFAVWKVSNQIRSAAIMAAVDRWHPPEMGFMPTILHAWNDEPI